MSHLGITACSLSVVLAAVAGQAPCASAVLIEKELLRSTELNQPNQLDAFGLTHTALGNAQLSMSPTGALVVSNIGSSGLDGVTMPIGDVRGNSMSMDLGDMGALMPGGLVAVAYPYSFGETQILFSNTSTSSCEISAVAPPTGGSCVTVSILNGCEVVDAVDWADATPGSSNWSVSGEMGTDPVTGEGISLSSEQVGADYVYTITLPTPTDLTISGRGPVYGATIQIAMRGMPPGQTVSGPVRVTAANTVDIEILSMDLSLPYWEPVVFGDDPFAYRRRGRVGVRSTGPSQKILGLDEAQACQAHPKAWFFRRGTLTPTRVLAVSNIGSSGLDGVAIDFATFEGCASGQIQCPDGSCVDSFADCNPRVADRIIHFGGKDVVAPDYLDLDSDNDTLRIGGVGSIGGGTGSGLGSIELRKEPGTIGELSLYTDFAAVGATIVHVEVWDNGTKVGEFDEFEQEADVLASMAHPLLTGIDITSTGMLGGDPLTPAGFFFTTQNPITVTGAGTVLVGNEVRVNPVDASSPVLFIKELHLTGTNLEDFDFRMDMSGDSGEYETALGVRHHAEGTAQLTVDENDHLVVSNIGSSGLDGVSVDLGEATGGSVRLADGGTFNVDSFFDYSLRTWWPDCDDDGDTLGVQMQATTPDHVTLTGSYTDPTAMLDITLRDATGAVTVTLTANQSESITLQSSQGGPIKHGFIRMATTKSPGSGGPDTTDTTLGFILDFDFDGDSEALIAISPAGISYPGVRFIEIGTTNSAASGNPTRIETRILRCVASQGFTLGQVQLGAFGVPGSSLGNARFWWNKKKSDADLSAAEQALDDCYRLSISNIGSSGEDGVSFDLSDELCNGRDDDCDGEIDEVWVDLRDMGGTTGPIKHGFVRLATTKSPGEIGQGGGGAVVYLDKSIVVGPAGEEIGVSMEDHLAIPVEYLVRVEVYDANGLLLAVEDENSHAPSLGSHPNILSFFGNTRDGKHKKKVKITKPVDASTPLLSSGNTGGDLPGPLPAILTRSGQVVQGASSYEITVFPTAEIPFYGLVAVDVRFATDPGTTGSVDIMGAGVGRLPPACQADINGDGILDNGDIGGFINAFLAGNISVDFNGDGILDNGDIGGFITAFLTGC